MVLGIAVAAALAALLYPMAAPRSTVQYVTAPVSRGPVARTVSASGTVNPQLTIIVGSYVSGVIVEIDCDFNTEVKKGQLCARIDPRPYQTAVDQAQAELGTAEAQLKKDQASRAYAAATFARDQGLVKNGFISGDVIDSARAELAQVQAQTELDQAAIRQKQASLKAVQVNLGYTDIVSPVDGTVVSRNITVGQTVAASFQTPTLFLIATDLTRMQVDTNVSESDIGAVKAEDPATFTVESFPDRRFTGTVSQVRQAPQTVQNVVTYDVIVNVANGDLALKPGMTATTRIVTQQRDNVLRVPDQALRYLPAGSAPARGAQVWILRNGAPRAVSVRTGLDDDTWTELTGGELQAGDAVIVGEQHGAASKGSAPFRFGF